METIANPPMRLPFPAREHRITGQETSRATAELSRATPTLSSSRQQIGGILVVLAGITLIFLVSGFFLFSHVPLQLPQLTLTLPPSWYIIGLTGIGSGLIVWIAFKQEQTDLHRQTTPIPVSPSTKEQSLFLLEPERPQASHLSPATAPQASGEIASIWENQLYTTTSKRELYILRQRLRFLRLYYAGEFAPDERMPHYQIKRRDGKIIFHRKPPRQHGNLRSLLKKS